MKTTLGSVRLVVGAQAQYQVHLAQRPDQVRAAQTLRFEVFNLELGEGLARSYAIGRDEDPFDGVCDHLLVQHLPSRSVVGTYRLQTGASAAAQLGYYCEQEFDFRPFEAIRPQLVELGRACVHRQHRNLVVLGLLWKGIAHYARSRGARYLIGCSSITSQDPAAGASTYATLCRRHLADSCFRTCPLTRCECPLDRVTPEPTSIPKLLRAYLTLGARICGPPAFDSEFGTIDFLTFLDLASLPRTVRQRFLS